MKGEVALGITGDQVELGTHLYPFLAERGGIRAWSSLSRAWDRERIPVLRSVRA
jgi:hypothetical protein